MLNPPRAPDGGAPPLGIVTRCTVVEAIDGDTLEIDVVKRVRVRLIDCWAPEKRTKDDREKKAGIAAWRHLAYLCQGQAGVLWIPGHESQEVGESLTLARVMGHVWIDGPDKRSLSARQVAAKHASTRKDAKLGT